MKYFFLFLILFSHALPSQSFIKIKGDGIPIEYNHFKTTYETVCLDTDIPVEHTGISFPTRGRKLMRFKKTSTKGEYNKIFLLNMLIGFMGIPLPINDSAFDVCIEKNAKIYETQSAQSLKTMDLRDEEGYYQMMDQCEALFCDLENQYYKSNYQEGKELVSSLDSNVNFYTTSSGRDMKTGFGFQDFFTLMKSEVGYDYKTELVDHYSSSTINSMQHDYQSVYNKMLKFCAHAIEFREMKYARGPQPKVGFFANLWAKFKKFFVDAYNYIQIGIQCYKQTFKNLDKTDKARFYIDTTLTILNESLSKIPIVGTILKFGKLIWTVINIMWGFVRSKLTPESAKTKEKTSFLRMENLARKLGTVVKLLITMVVGKKKFKIFKNARRVHRKRI